MARVLRSPPPRGESGSTSSTVYSTNRPSLSSAENGDLKKLPAASSFTSRVLRHSRESVEATRTQSTSGPKPPSERETRRGRKTRSFLQIGLIVTEYDVVDVPGSQPRYLS